MERGRGKALGAAPNIFIHKGRDAWCNQEWSPEVTLQTETGELLRSQLALVLLLFLQRVVKLAVGSCFTPAISCA